LYFAGVVVVVVVGGGGGGGDEILSPDDYLRYGVLFDLRISLWRSPSRGGLLLMRNALLDQRTLREESLRDGN